MGPHQPNLGLTQELESLEVFNNKLNQLETNIHSLFENMSNTFNHTYNSETTQESLIELVKQVESLEELVNSNGVGALKLEDASLDIKDIKSQIALTTKRTQSVTESHKKWLENTSNIVQSLSSTEDSRIGFIEPSTGINTPM